MDTSPPCPHNFFAAIRPANNSLLGKCLSSISNPRRHRWKSYLRACKLIPKTSPVYGSTCFKKLNARRLSLVELKLQNQLGEKAQEYEALKKATRIWVNGPIIAANFLLARQQRANHKLRQPPTDDRS